MPRFDTPTNQIILSQLTVYQTKLLRAASGVRRILKRGEGGGQKFQKISEKYRSEFEIVTLKIRPIFSPKTGEEQKKRSSPKY